MAHYCDPPKNTNYGLSERGFIITCMTEFNESICNKKILKAGFHSTSSLQCMPSSGAIPNNTYFWASWYDLVNMIFGHSNNRCREKHTDTKIATFVCALQQLNTLDDVHLSVHCNACTCEPHFTRVGKLTGEAAKRLVSCTVH